MRRRWRFLAPLAIVGILLFVAIGGAVVQLLWNWLLPSLFGWPEVTFWQALALLALCRILFGGFGRHGVSRRFRGRMRERMAERWERMTPDERERFKQGMRGRGSCGASTRSESPDNDAPSTAPAPGRAASL